MGSQAFSNLFGWVSNSRGPGVRSLLLEPSDSPNMPRVKAVTWEPAVWGKHKGAEAQRGRGRLREGVCKREDSETEKERHREDAVGVRKECWKESSEREDGGSEMEDAAGEAQRGTLLRWETPEKFWGKDQRELACGVGGAQRGRMLMGRFREGQH